MMSLAQQIEEVERELNYRRGVYPRLVAMQRMQAVLETLQRLNENQ